MEVRLESDVTARVTQLVANGAATSPDELVNAALRRHLDKQACQRRYDQLKHLIQEGVECAELGELRDGEEVFAEVLRELGDDGADDA